MAPSGPSRRRPGRGREASGNRRSPSRDSRFPDGPISARLQQRAGAAAPPAPREDIMRIRTVCLALVCLMTLFARTSLAGPEPGTFYLRGFVGYSSQALKDVNDDIENTSSFLSLVS